MALGSGTIGLRYFIIFNIKATKIPRYMLLPGYFERECNICVVLYSTVYVYLVAYIMHYCRIPPPRGVVYLVVIGCRLMSVAACCYAFFVLFVVCLLSCCFLLSGCHEYYCFDCAPCWSLSDCSCAVWCLSCCGSR